MAKLSVELERYFFQEDRDKSVSLEDILNLAGEKAFGFLLIVLSLPSALPIPIPGYSTPLGFLIFLLAMQLIVGRKTPWVPQRLNKSSISLQKAQKLVKAGLPWIKRIEGLTRPRMSYICHGFPGRLILGIVIVIMSVFLILPFPGSNNLPAAGIFVIGFGLQEDDGLISLAGLAVCAIATVVVTAILFTGASVLDRLINYFR